MLLGIAGVTGVGKSYYKNLLASKMGFRTVKIITTRPLRKNEQNGVDKTFMTANELKAARERGEIAFEFEMCGNLYAYPKSELFGTDDNIVTEIHYETIHDLKKAVPELKTIYLLPKDLALPKAKVRERGLSPEVEQTRLAEIDTHYQRILADETLRRAFDFTMQNNYDDKSEAEFLRLTKALLEGENE